MPTIARTPVAHTFASFAIATLLIVAGAQLAEPFNLPFVHGWALAHGTIFILFPAYFLVAYLLLWPVLYRRPAHDVASVSTRPSVLALTAFVVSISSVVIPFGIVSLVALILAMLALRRIRTTPNLTGKGLAWMALGVAAIALLRQLYMLSLLLLYARDA